MTKSIVPVNQIVVRSSTCYEFSNPNSAEVVEIEDDDTSVETVEKQMENLKLNFQFNEKDVPEIFKTLINDRMDNIEKISLKLHDSFCLLGFDDFVIGADRENGDCSVTYVKSNTEIKTDDPEKSIIDHLWFVLKNPNIKLKHFAIVADLTIKTTDIVLYDYERLISMLQPMFDTFDHHIKTRILFTKLDEDTFLSMLKHIEPETLNDLYVDISWKQEGNYQKMKEIVETDQWKQAISVSAYGVTPLKIDDLLQYRSFWLEIKSITPEDVLRVTEHVLNTAHTQYGALSCQNQNLDIDAIIDFLRSKFNGTDIFEIEPDDPEQKYCYRMANLRKCIHIYGIETHIIIRNMSFHNN